MAFPQDTQKQATTNDTAEQALDVAGSTGQPVGAGTIAVETVVSGTAKRINASRDTDIYVDIGTSASLKVEIGPTSAAATTIYRAASAAVGMMSFRLPIGWYVKFTGTVADFVVTSVAR